MILLSSLYSQLFFTQVTQPQEVVEPIDGKPRKSPRKPQPNPKYLAILGDKNNKSPAVVQEELMQKS